jgi:hypothetical protein
MTATNVDDSMGVAMEIPNAVEDDISDLENKIDYPSQAEVNVARIAHPSWLVDARNVVSACPPHQVATTADGSLAPHDIASIGEASTSQLNARTSAAVNTDFAQYAADSLRVSLTLVEVRRHRDAQRNQGSPSISHGPYG